MTVKSKFLISVGTRPEIIKMVPIYNELKKLGETPVLLHTGQHTSMAIALYEFFGIVPDYSINLERKYDNKPDDLSGLSAILLQNISSVMMEINPEVVLVHGDTSTAFISALAAFYQQRPVAHIEAGLRSHNKYDPFPEENNRVLIAKLAKWSFAPTFNARENLIKEGVVSESIYVVGNTIIDAAQLGISKLDEYFDKVSDSSELIFTLKNNFADKKMLLVTAHRRENQKENIAVIAESICELLQEHDELFAVWPVHPNPVVMDAVYNVIDKMPKNIRLRMHLAQPLDYPALLWILKNSWLVLTDSGGIQEEAIALNTPVLVLRETTERPEVIKAKAGILVGTQKDKIKFHVEELLNDKRTYDAMCEAKNPYGDGKAAKYICETLIKASAKGKQLVQAAILSFTIIISTLGVANANEYAEEPSFNKSGFLEAGGEYHSLNNNYGNWHGQYLKGNIQTDKNNIWNAELANQKKFNDSGYYAAIGNTHIYNEDWFSAVTVGAGNGGVFLPRYRLDGFINRKLLPSRQLIATLGLGIYNAMDAHEDRSLFAGATYYFASPWIIQGGIRLNNSNPGSVNSTSQFIAVTQGKDKDYFITARYGFGREAYQVIGPGQALSNFRSNEVSLELRKWLSPKWGFNIRGEKYSSPNYDRTGISSGIFMAF